MDEDVVCVALYSIQNWISMDVAMTPRNKQAALLVCG